MSNAEFLQRMEQNRKRLIEKGHLQFKTRAERLKDIEEEELRERVLLRRRISIVTNSDKARQMRAIHDNKKLSRWLL